MSSETGEGRMFMVKAVDLAASDVGYRVQFEGSNGPVNGHTLSYAGVIEIVAQDLHSDNTMTTRIVLRGSPMWLYVREEYVGLVKKGRRGRGSAAPTERPIGIDAKGDFVYREPSGKLYALDATKGERVPVHGMVLERGMLKSRLKLIEEEQVITNKLRREDISPAEMKIGTDGSVFHKNSVKAWTLRYPDGQLPNGTRMEDPTGMVWRVLGQKVHGVYFLEGEVSTPGLERHTHRQLKQMHAWTILDSKESGPQTEEAVADFEVPPFPEAPHGITVRDWWSMRREAIPVGTRLLDRDDFEWEVAAVPDDGRAYFRLVAVHGNRPPFGAYPQALLGYRLKDVGVDGVLPSEKEPRERTDGELLP